MNELVSSFEVLDPELTRPQLRRYRIRDPDTTMPELLAELGSSLNAGFLLSAVVHEAEPGPVPCFAASARLYSLEDGLEKWSGFQTSSGSASSSFLGLGGTTRVEELAPRVSADLFEDLVRFVAADRQASRGHANTTEAVTTDWVLIPFSSQARSQATRRAEMATAAVRSAASARNLRLLSANEVNLTIRRLRIQRLGETAPTLRLALADQFGASLIITGSLESYEANAGSSNPNPHAVLSMRSVDAATGQIQWSDALDWSGWDGVNLLGLGRTLCGSDLVSRMADRLVRHLVDARSS